MVKVTDTGTHQLTIPPLFGTTVKRFIVQAFDVNVINLFYLSLTLSRIKLDRLSFESLFLAKLYIYQKRRSLSKCSIIHMRTNTLAYLSGTIAIVKSFINLTPGACTLKLFCGSNCCHIAIG
jgi:hypothetical protein